MSIYSKMTVTIKNFEIFEIWELLCLFTFDIIKFIAVSKINWESLFCDYMVC